MRNKKLLTIAALIAVGLGKQAVANDKIDDRLYVAPSISYLNLDNQRNSSNDALGINVAIGKVMDENINVELKGLYNKSLQQGKSGKFDSLGATIDVQYYLNRNDLAPYFVAGVGIMGSDTDGRNEIGTIAEAGAGVAYKINDNLSLRSDVRYRYNHNFSKDRVSNVNNFDDVIVNVGLVIPFGKKGNSVPTDSDNDGVLNSFDKCPDTKQGVQVNEYGCNQGVNLVGVNFEFDSAKLTSTTKDSLDALSKDLIAKPQDKSIEIQGHTSSEGSEAYNMNLSQKRANSVVGYLTSKNIKNKMNAVGYGKERPVADNSTEEGRIKNRRVELVWE